MAYLNLPCLARHIECRICIQILIGPAHLGVGVAHQFAKPKSHSNDLLKLQNLANVIPQVSKTSHFSIARDLVLLDGVLIGEKSNPNLLHSCITKLSRVL